MNATRIDQLEQEFRRRLRHVASMANPVQELTPGITQDTMRYLLQAGAQSTLRDIRRLHRNPEHADVTAAAG